MCTLLPVVAHYAALVRDMLWRCQRRVDTRHVVVVGLSGRQVALAGHIRRLDILSAGHIGRRRHVVAVVRSAIRAVGTGHTGRNRGRSHVAVRTDRILRTGRIPRHTGRTHAPAIGHAHMDRTGPDIRRIVCRRDVPYRARAGRIPDVPYHRLADPGVSYPAPSSLSAPDFRAVLSPFRFGVASELFALRPVDHIPFKATLLNPRESLIFHTPCIGHFSKCKMTRSLMLFLITKVIHFLHINKQPISCRVVFLSQLKRNPKPLFVYSP